MNVKNSTTKNLLKYLAIRSGFIVLYVLAPQLPLALLKAYLRDKKFQRWLFLKDLKRLQVRELIDYQELSNGSIKIILKKRGKEKNIQYKLEDLKIEKPKRWDGKWQLVIFDIPDNKKKARDALRYKLKDLGFYQLQKSVFIYPYPCENEIDFVASIFDVRKHILILYIDHFEDQEKFKHYFHLN